MQAVDRFPAAPAAGNEPAAASLEKNHGQPLPDEFGRVMQQALAAKPKHSPRLAPPRPETAKAPPAKTIADTDNIRLISSEQKITGKDSTTKPVAQTEKIPATVSADQSAAPAEVNVLPLLDLPATPTVLVAGQWIPDSSSVPLSTSTKNIFTAPADTSAVLTIDGKGAVALATEKSNPLAPETSPAKTTPGSPSQKPEQVNNTAAADAAALVKNVAVAADKNSPAAEIPKPAVNQEPVVTEELAKNASALAPAAANDGTGVATVDLPMKKSANTNKVAGLAGKVLPGDASLPAAAKVLPTSISVAVRTTDGGSADSNFNQPMPAAVATVDFSTAPATVAVPAFMEARLRNLERTHDMVALHAVRLVESQTDTLSVVIKPGAGTELSLQLRQRDGGVEAHAVLQRGDFQLMNQHWPELQQRLEQRGIKLAPLGSETNFTADNGSSFKQQQQASQEAEAQKASAFAEFALAGSRALGATARLAVGVSGWESWA